MLRDVFELLSFPPHDLPHERLTARERRIYLLGYDYALIIALRVLQAAVENHHTFAKLRRRLERAEAARRREETERLRLLLKLCCAKWDAQRGHFCGAPAKFVMVDAQQRPVELRCFAHRTDSCHELTAVVQPGYASEGEWVIEWDTGDLRAKKHRP
jgi:hypothetical protein